MVTAAIHRNHERNMTMMRLGDDGTLDTVIVCSECGEEFRFNFDGGDITPNDGPAVAEAAYNDFVKWAMGEAADDHGRCPGKDYSTEEV